MQTAANDNAAAQSATAFVVGQTYGVRSICDHDCIFTFEVIARTPKTVVLRSGTKEVRRHVRVWDGVECCDPHGRYSMSPVLTANPRRN